VPEYFENDFVKFLSVPNRHLRIDARNQVKLFAPLHIRTNAIGRMLQNHSIEAKFKVFQHRICRTVAKKKAFRFSTLQTAVPNCAQQARDAAAAVRLIRWAFAESAGKQL